MEGPEIDGPKVWLDLNRKCEAKIIAFINKNQERSSWLKQYLEDCKAKLGAALPEPEFVPKTPSQPKRGGRRGKASTASQESNTSTQSTRSTRATRGAKRDVTVETIAPVVEPKKDEVTPTPPPKKANTSTTDKSVVFAAEPANATYNSSQDLGSEASAIANATFDVASENTGDNNVTYQADTATAVAVNDATYVAENDEVFQNNSAENDQFIEAEVVEKPQEVVNNIVEILKHTHKDDGKMPSPIPAPRTLNKITTNQVVDDVDSKPSRSTRTKQKQVEEVVAEVANNSKADTSAADTTAKRSTRTKTKNNTSTGDESAPTRSTRTRQKNLPSSEDDKTASEAEPAEEARPARSTRTKQKQLAQSCSESTLTKGAASPRVRELAAQVLSPAIKHSASTSRLPGGYAGSPVRDRVKVFEQAMRDSAGLKKRRSSIANSLARVSAARNLSVNDVIAEQEVQVVKKGPTIKKSPGVTNTSALNNSRAPAGKVVRPGRKVFASGGRGVSPATGPRSGSNTGSSSNLMRSRSRLDIIERNGKTTPSKANTPNNLVRGGLTSFLPSKPKGPTLDEIQEQKDSERRMKEQREVEAKQRRDEQMKNKAEEQRLKREERIRRVQEARQKQESQREDKMRKNQEKDKEEKLALLKKREDNLKAEAEKRKKENEIKLKEAEERRNRDEEERLARQDKLESERREDERKKDEEQRRRKLKEEEERRKKIQEEEKRKRQEEQRREEERRKLEEEKKRTAAAQQERIQREKEEMKKIKDREAARQAELNLTQTKPTDTTLNRTQTLDQSQAGVSSYDMTPARHELPPEPSQAEDNYGLDDLKSDEDTDDEDCPRKQVPKWAEGTQLRTSLLKQCYMGPDLDQIFFTVEMPDLSTMFDHQRKRFFKRTSSACWETPPESFKHSKRW